MLSCAKQARPFADKPNHKGQKVPEEMVLFGGTIFLLSQRMREGPL